MYNIQNGGDSLNRLRQLREEREMTQKDLGALLKVQNSAISKYEVGRSSLTDDLIEKLCAIFDVSSDYLLGFSNERKPNKKSAPLTEKQGEQIVQRALKDTGLLDKDGGLSEEGGKVISDFLRSNAEILKQLLDK